MSSHLSLTGKRWILSEQKQKAMISSSLAEARGIDLGEIPTWEKLSDPLTLGDTKKAVERIRKAIDAKECVGIIGDYDADGITGTAQLVRFFMRHGITPSVILPHRENDGYGIQKEFIDQLDKQRVTLMLTVDTGIVHLEEIAYARSKNIDVIVTDHHACREELPDAIIVHPLAKIPYGNPNLCGSGVAFTLIRALEDDDWEGKEVDLALATIGTVADVVPLVGENRMIVQLGLEVMNSMCHPEASRRMAHAPVFELAKSVMKNDEPLTSIHIGFRIAPRINAAGRISHPKVALTALLEGGNELDELQILNDRRRDLTELMMEEAEEMISDASIISICTPSLHAGIIGLISGRLAEKHGKPCIVCTESDDTVTCSLRSIPSYHIAEALERCSKHLATYGGHRAAGGCTLEKKNWEAFQKAIQDDAAKQLEGMELSPTLKVDAVLDEKDLTLSAVQSLQKLEPFGEGNPEPRFLIHNQELSQARCVGADGEHLQCTIGKVKSVGFRLGHLESELPERADVVVRVGIDTWGKREQVQLFIEDLAQAVPVQSSPKAVGTL